MKWDTCDDLEVTVKKRTNWSSRFTLAGVIETVVGRQCSLYDTHRYHTHLLVVLHQLP